MAGVPSRMSSERFLHSWQALLEHGQDQAAAKRICDRYWRRLVGLAKNMMRDRLRAVGADDIAQEALADFCARVEEGQYRSIEKRSSLWALLAEIVRSRAVDRFRHETAAKRGGGEIRGNSVVADSINSDGAGGFDAFAAEPTDDDVAELQECLELLHGRLTQDEWQLCLWKAEGLSNAAVASKRCCSEEKARLLWKGVVSKANRVAQEIAG